MTTAPANAKRPQDRKPKAVKSPVTTGVEDGQFWFEYEDERYDFEPVNQDTLTPGEFRQHQENPLALTYLIMERVAPAAALRAIDSSWAVHNAVIPKFDDYSGEALGASLGES